MSASWWLLYTSLLIPCSMAVRYSRSAPRTTVSFEDITLPETFDTCADSDLVESTTRASSASTRQPMASQQNNSGAPTPVFTPEQEAWIEKLIFTRTNNGTTSAASSIALPDLAVPPCRVIGKQKYFNSYSCQVIIIYRECVRVY